MVYHGIPPKWQCHIVDGMTYPISVFPTFFPVLDDPNTTPTCFFQSPRKPAVDEAARAEGALFLVKIVRTSNFGWFCGDNNLQVLVVQQCLTRTC